MIAGHARREVLWRFDATRSGFNGNARNGDGSAGPARVGVQRLFAYLDALGRIWEQNAGVFHIACHVDYLRLGGQLAAQVKLDVVLHVDHLPEVREPCVPDFDCVIAGGDVREREVAVLIGPHSLRLGGRRAKAHVRQGHRLALRIAQAAGKRGGGGSRHQDESGTEHSS